MQPDRRRNHRFVFLRPLRGFSLDGFRTQGSASLHPGLRSCAASRLKAPNEQLMALPSSQNIVTLADGHSTLWPYPSSAERITVTCETQQVNSIGSSPQTHGSRVPNVPCSLQVGPGHGQQGKKLRQKTDAVPCFLPLDRPPPPIQTTEKKDTRQ